jgi:biopolymer transport protein ExbD
MITRPLDLASKMRPPPRNFDGLFFVAAGFIALFFLMFGSRFVLAPGLGVDFRLPEMTGAAAGATRTTHSISVTAAGVIFTDQGALSLPKFGEWLKEQAKTTKNPTLLVRAGAAVPLSLLTTIKGLADESGFRVIAAADEPVAKPSGIP